MSALLWKKAKIKERMIGLKKAQQGDWVEIYQVVLKAGERATNIPEDTQKVPLELKTKGWLTNSEAAKGEIVVIKTVLGRTLQGELINLNPSYQHNFGKPIPQLLAVGPQLRAFLTEGEN